jgi:hypothetical protein
MLYHRVYLWLAVLCFLALGPACSSQADQPAAEGSDQMTIQLSSSAFTEAETIPKKYTCDGQDVSPPLSWTGVPTGTNSLLLIVDDPDAPRGTWVHWVLIDLPVNLDGLPEGVQGDGIEGVNDFGRQGYGGPCPPRGSNHRYYFKLYALDKVLGLKAGATKSEAEKAMQGHVLAWGQLMGRYAR